MRLTVGGVARPLTIGGLAIDDLLTNRGFRNCAIRLAIEAMTIEGSGEMAIDDWAALPIANRDSPNHSMSR
jgi:hypothetical protein